MKAFLDQLAEVYLKNDCQNLLDYCFVFPNKRSGIFFRHYLTAHAAGRPLLLPHIATIGELFSTMSPLAEASRLDKLFLLYEEYSKLSDEIADFDRFLFWGEMILSDFDDVDLNLADAKKLFVNLKRYREINSYYLTGEQETILAKYWGTQYERHSPDSFWSHLNEGSNIEKKFLRLWEVLGNLYENFHKTLIDRGLGTRGMIARDAVDRLTSGDLTTLPFRRYIFVGFNVLSLAEIKLFDILQSRGLADFYWDLPLISSRMDDNKAMRFMRRNMKCFKPMYELEPYSVDLKAKAINITGVSSGVGQTKDAGARLQKWIEKGVIADPSNAIETAVILPDESLFIPMTHSVPPEITALNVTMGFPLRSTSFASFISAIVSLQLRAQRSHDEWFFFHEDVTALVSHPLLRRINQDHCDKIEREIRDRRLYLVPEKWLKEEFSSFAQFFTIILDSDSSEEVYIYFHSFLSALLKALTSGNREIVSDEGELDEGGNAIEVFFIRSYLDALDELKSAIDRRKIKMKEMTFIQLLQKTIASTTVNFAGEPLRGLQMMGVLETRALDFDNVIILSMNENVFPRKLYSRSFIPDNLRRSYGLPTSDYQDSIFSYIFYRLLSRAKHVSLYYDARNVSGRNSEMSRYLAQLLYLVPELKVNHELVSFPLPPLTEESISIKKTPEIMAKLREFTPEGGSRTLSASSINTYINCPLSFYLTKICRLDLDEQVIDYMDSGTYGSILHEVSEWIYKDFLDGADEVKVTEEMLDRVIRSASYLDTLITHSVNDNFNKLGKKCDRPLTGEAKVLGVIIKHFISMMLAEEKKIAPFDFLKAEFEIERSLKITDDLSINIRQIIDRIDRVYPPGHYGEESLGTLRIVDYKTGGDSISFSNFDQLFSNEVKDRRKAIVQLLFYCNAYAAEKNIDGPILPVIYLMKTLSTTGIRPLSFEKKPVEDYRDLNEEYMERFRSVIKEMFDPEVPFVQAPSDHNCTFCTLSAICHRK